MPTLTETRDADWLIHRAPELIPQAAVCDITGLATITVAQMIADGKLPAMRLRRRVLVPRQAVLDLLHLDRSGSRDSGGDADGSEMGAA